MSVSFFKAALAFCIFLIHPGFRKRKSWPTFSISISLNNSCSILITNNWNDFCHWVFMVVLIYFNLKSDFFSLQLLTMGKRFLVLFPCHEILPVITRFIAINISFITKCLGLVWLIACLVWAIFGINHPRYFWKLWNCPCFSRVKPKFLKMFSASLFQIALQICDY